MDKEVRVEAVGGVMVVVILRDLTEARRDLGVDTLGWSLLAGFRSRCREAVEVIV